MGSSAASSTCAPKAGILLLRAEVGQQPPHALELRVAAGDLDEPPLGHARAAGGLKG